VPGGGGSTGALAVGEGVGAATPLRSSTLAGGWRGVIVQACINASIAVPASAARDNRHKAPGRRGVFDMLWLILEALAAGALLVLIVWWTMFSGRRKGERRSDDDDKGPGDRA
jgi:hypothetical protein